MKRKVWIGLLFSALLFLLACDVFAETGSCGDGLTYSLEGTALTIKKTGPGTGKMQDYDYDLHTGGTTAPWGGLPFETAVIGDGVTSIGNYAFYECRSLTGITLPSGVTSIGEDAFSYCPGLTEITLPPGVTSIGEYAFGGCRGLTEIILPSGTETIGGFAFYDCGRLERVELPSTLKSVGYYVFQGDSRLADVYFDGTEMQWDGVGKDDRWRTNAPEFKMHFRCTVSFNANGHGTAPAPVADQWTEEKTADPGELTADGFVFTGWYKDEACTEKWDFDKEAVPGDMTLYAGWKEDESPAPGPDEDNTVPQTDGNDTAPAPSAVKTATPPLLAKMTAKGSNSLVLSWNRTAGAEGYDIFFAKCSSRESRTPFRRVKTIKGNKTFKWTKKGLKKGISYKAYVKAWVTKDGKKQYVVSSPKIHAFTSGGTAKYTNAKSVTVNRKKVTVKKGKTFKLKAAVKKLKKNRKLMPTSHEPVLRYVSTDKKIATVNRSGRIKGVGKGTCYVYAYAQNGVRKKVKVTVS